MTAAIDAARARARPLLEPFAGARGGRPCRDDPRAQWIGDATLIEPIVRRPWPRILGESEALLREVGKDLRIAGIWAAAAFECEGLMGLAAGLAALAGLLRELWDDLEPARARARENALANFYEHLAARLPALTIDGADEAERAALAACEALLEELHAAACDRLAPPPMPRQARAELARLRASLPAAAAGVEEDVAADRPEGTGPKGQVERAGAPAPAPGAAAPAEPGSRGRAASPAGEPPTAAPPAERPPAAAAPPARAASLPPPAPPLRDADDPDELQRFVAGLSQGMIKAAGALRRRDPADPLAYRLLRLGAWLRAARPPEAGGRIPVAGMRPDVRQPLEAMLRHGKWAALVDAAEAALARPEARFHLDLHRFTLAGLAGLGEGHGEARAAVLGELAGLLRRMPGLERRCDRDGAPLADEATRALLRREGLAQVAGDAARPGDAGHGTSFFGDFSAPPGAPSSPPPAAAPPSRAVAAPPVAAPSPAPSTRPPGHVPSDLSSSAAPDEGASDPDAALARLQLAVDAAPTARARFTARTALAASCRALGRHAVASALFVALEREARGRDLAAWEPALVAPVLAGLLATPGLAADERARVFTDLCLLDPGAALRVAASAPHPAR